jgi:hypothetical protein
MIFENKTVALVTRVMNHADFLAKTLPTWTAIKEYDKIIIVDWSSAPPLLNLSKDKRVSIVRKDGEKYFNRAAAWNLGLDQVRDYDYVNLVDCDIIVDKSMLTGIIHDTPIHFYIVGSFREGAGGTCIFTKEQLQKVPRFDERLAFYGPESGDFFTKMQIAGFSPLRTINYKMIRHISHSDARRFQEQPEKRVYKQKEMQEGTKHQ